MWKYTRRSSFRLSNNLFIRSSQPSFLKYHPNFTTLHTSKVIHSSSYIISSPSTFYSTTPPTPPSSSSPSSAPTPTSTPTSTPETSLSFTAKVSSKLKHIKHKIYEGANHYWIGSKLLVLNTRVAFQILRKLTKGHTLTRRERRQLIRTSADLFRLVPMIIIVIIPFLEFLLPVILKLFPNMLPSTFEDNLKKEENMQKQVAAKIKVAKFLQDTVEELANLKDDSELFGTDFSDFMKAVRSGQPISSSDLIKFAKLFRDDFTIDNLDRTLLVSMCKFLGLTHYGTEGFLRYQINNKLKSIKADDKMIFKEGVDSLTFEELQLACIARGMQGLGVSKQALKKQMAEWIDTSITQSIPMIIMILSRALGMTANLQKTDEYIKETLMIFPDEILEEAELRSEEGRKEKNLTSIRELKLEVLRHTKEKLTEEHEETAETKEDIEEVDVTAKGGIRDATHAMSLLFAGKSPVHREKEDLKGLRQDVKALKTEREVKEEDKIRSKLKDRLAQKLDLVVEKLEKEVVRVEEKYGDKLSVLDLDRDGRVTVAEIYDAIKLLKVKPSDQDLKEFLELIDTDKDGIVLIKDVDRLKKKIDELNDDDYDDRDEPEPEPEDSVATYDDKHTVTVTDTDGAVDNSVGVTENTTTTTTTTDNVNVVNDGAVQSDGENVVKETELKK